MAYKVLAYSMQWPAVVHHHVCLTLVMIVTALLYSAQQSSLRPLKGHIPVLVKHTYTLTARCNKLCASVLTQDKGSTYEVCHWLGNLKQQAQKISSAMIDSSLSELLQLKLQAHWPTVGWFNNQVLLFLFNIIHNIYPLWMKQILIQQCSSDHVTDRQMPGTVWSLTHEKALQCIVLNFSASANKQFCGWIGLCCHSSSSSSCQCIVPLNSVS